MEIKLDGDKAYGYEGRAIMTAAVSLTDLVSEIKPEWYRSEGEQTVAKQDFAVGDRVEVGGQTGTISHIVTTVYGDTASVTLDNGEVEGLFVESLVSSEVEQPKFASAVEEIVSEFENYESFYAAGLDEIKRKAKKARELNLRAKAMLSGAKIEDKIRLDKILVTTNVDLASLKEDEQNLEAAEAGYLESLPRYEMQQGTASGHDHTREDASWIVEAAEDQQTELDAINWEGFLATEAVDLVARVSDPVVQNEQMLDEASADYFQYLAHGLDQENYKVRLAQFKGFVRTSKTERVEKIASKEAAQKTASVEDDTPFESLFL